MMSSHSARALYWPAEISRAYRPLTFTHRLPYESLRRAFHHISRIRHLPQARQDTAHIFISFATGRLFGSSYFFGPLLQTRSIDQGANHFPTQTMHANAHP